MKITLPIDLSTKIGAPEVIRTPDVRLRRPTLYPAELRAQYVIDNFSRVLALRNKTYKDWYKFLIKTILFLHLK